MSSKLYMLVNSWSKIVHLVKGKDLTTTAFLTG